VYYSEHGFFSVSIPGVCASQEVIEQLMEMTTPHYFLLVAHHSL
jgi:hypothetical protein